MHAHTSKNLCICFVIIFKQCIYTKINKTKQNKNYLGGAGPKSQEFCLNRVSEGDL